MGRRCIRPLRGASALRGGPVCQSRITAKAGARTGHDYGRRRQDALDLRGRGADAAGRAGLDADRIPRHHVAIKGDAEFRRPALGLEVDVVEPEALFVAEDPFEIVYQAPEEIAADLHALRR